MYIHGQLKQRSRLDLFIVAFWWLNYMLNARIDCFADGLDILCGAYALVLDLPEIHVQ